MDWFLYRRDFRHERVKQYRMIITQVNINSFRSKFDDLVSGIKWNIDGIYWWYLRLNLTIASLIANVLLKASQHLIG